MGGQAVALRVARIDSRASAGELHDAIYRAVAGALSKVVRGAAYAQVTEEYLDASREDGRPHAREHELVFAFRDAGGTSMSMTACVHWFEVAIAALRGPAPGSLDALARSLGWTLAGKAPKLATLLAATTRPLIELRRTLYVVHPGKQPRIETDTDLDGALALADLRTDELAAVRAVATSKRCACKLCGALRAGKRLRVEAAVVPLAKAPPSPPLQSTEVEFEDKRAKAVPIELLANPGLTELCIRAPITALPDVLAQRRELTRLQLVGARLDRIPRWVLELPKLRSLELVRGSLAGFETPRKSSTLETLRIEDVTCGPNVEPPFAKLPKLETLSWTGCKLATLPASIGKARALESLDLESNRLRELPDAVGKLSKLRWIELAGNPLERLPGSLARLALDKLSVTDTRISALPEGIRVDTLDAIKTRIAALPESIGKSGLTSLVVTDCPLAALPESLGMLKGLEYLFISNTEVRVLPARVAGLKELKVVSIYNTAIERVPEWVGSLKKLYRLEISRNQLGRGDLARLKKQLPGATIQVHG